MQEKYACHMTFTLNVTVLEVTLFVQVAVLLFIVRLWCESLDDKILNMQKKLFIRHKCEAYTTAVFLLPERKGQGKM